MRLVVKQNGRTVNEFQFRKGPVYIGRAARSQVFLPDRAVSRQHAVIFRTQDGKWMVEDLDSANKTYLNDQEVHKAEIETGDCLGIVDFTIEVNLEGDAESGKAINLEDTLVVLPQGGVPASPGPPASCQRQEGGQIIVRKPDADHAPAIRLPAKRMKDFLHATEAICKADGLDQLLTVLLDTVAKQFAAYRTWCALRSEPAGPMTAHAGKRRDGQVIQLSNIKLSEKIDEAVEKCQFLLLPRVPAQREQVEINSALIGPIMDAAGCFGVLYVDNDLSSERYGLGDLDYLMLLAIHTAAILENF